MSHEEMAKRIRQALNLLGTLPSQGDSTLGIYLDSGVADLECAVKIAEQAAEWDREQRSAGL